MPNYLPRDEFVDELHQEGLEDALDGRFDPAHDTFNEALDYLRDEEQTLPIVVQAARITRDDGFTYVREGLIYNNQEMLGLGRSHLVSARNMTNVFVSGLAPMRVERIRSSRVRREVFAEHAATLGCLGRTALAEQLMSGSTPDPAAQFEYGLAHDIARSGNNKYYEASNAIRGALAERANEHRLLYVVPWLGRAAKAVTKAAISDRDNLQAASSTVARIAPHLLTRQRAIQSTLSRP